MNVTLITRTGGRITTCEIIAWDTREWTDVVHQLYQLKAVAGYVIRP